MFSNAEFIQIPLQFCVTNRLRFRTFIFGEKVVLFSICLVIMILPKYVWNVYRRLWKYRNKNVDFKVKRIQIVYKCVCARPVALNLWLCFHSVLPVILIGCCIVHKHPQEIELLTSGYPPTMIPSRLNH